jgi:hypothetical protein
VEVEVAEVPRRKTQEPVKLKEFESGSPMSHLRDRRAICARTCIARHPPVPTHIQSNQSWLMARLSRSDRQGRAATPGLAPGSAHNASMTCTNPPGPHTHTAHSPRPGVADDPM